MKLRPVFLLLLLLAAPAFAGDLRGVCDVRFLGSSTLHDFSGKCVCMPFHATVMRDAAGKAVLPSVDVEVSVAEMTTENESRDGQMRKMFDAGRFPRILASARDVDVDRLRGEMGKDAGGKAPLDLMLRIRDVERKVRATASGLKESGERVTFAVEFPLSLKEFGLKAPSVLGIVRVGDKVSVKATFTLTVSGSP